MKQQEKQPLDSNSKKKIRAFIIVIGILIGVGLIAEKINPSPTACDCMKNLDKGYYDLLSKPDKEVRNYCNDKYAGSATMWLECNGK
jgi:hypothetical protein